MKFWIVFWLWLAVCLSEAWAQFNLNETWVFGNLDADDALHLYENRQSLDHFKEVAREYWSHSLEQMQNLFQPLDKERDLFYSVASAVLNEAQNAEAKALLFIRSPHARNWIVQLNFYLGLYYFNHDNYKQALKYLAAAELSFLDNAQIMALKFCQAYAYFVSKEFVRAFVLFDAVRQVEQDNPFFHDASYYFAFLHLYLKKNYNEAIFQLRRIQKDSFYANIVPYYIGYLMYLSGKRADLISYIQSVLPTKGLLYKQAMVELLGYLYFEQRDYAKVIEYFTSHKDLAEGELSRNDAYLLGYSYYQMQNLDSASYFLRKVTAGHSDALFFNATYNLGNAYLRQGKKVEARRAFVQCMSGNPNLQEQQNASFLYAKLSLDLGFVDVALNTIKRYINDYPEAEDLQEARNILILGYANSHNYKEAVQFMKQLPGSSPPQIIARVYYGRAVELMHDEKRDSALVFLDKVIHNRLSNSYYYYAALFWKAQLLIEREQYATAIALLEKTLKIPSSLMDAEINLRNIRYNIGNVNFTLHNYKQALVMFVAVMQEVEKSPQAMQAKQRADLWIKTADCYFILRKYKQATELYRSIIRANGRYTDYAAYQLALLEGINSPARKNQDLQHFLAAYPNSTYVPLALLELGKSYLSRYIFDSATRAFDQLLAEDRTSDALRAAAWLNLGIIALQQEKKPQAIEYLTSLLERYPNSPEAQTGLEFFKDAYVAVHGIHAYFDYLKQKGYVVSVQQEDSAYYDNLEQQKRAGAWAAVKKSAQQYLTVFPAGFYRKEVLYTLLQRAEAEKNDAEIVQYADSLLQGANLDYKVQVARIAAIAVFDRLQDYAKSLPYLQTLLQDGTKEDKGHALQALLIAYYHLGEKPAGYALSLDFAADSTLTNPSVLPYFAYFRAEHLASQGEYLAAAAAYTEISKYNQGELAAVAAHKIALMYYLSGDLAQAEKRALDAVKAHSSYELWIIKSYLLLGQIYAQQQDYFNAKATYKSIMENTSIDSLQREANARLEQIQQAETAGVKDPSAKSSVELKTALDTVPSVIPDTLPIDSPKSEPSPKPISQNSPPPTPLATPLLRPGTLPKLKAKPNPKLNHKPNPRPNHNSKSAKPKAAKTKANLRSNPKSNLKANLNAKPKPQAKAPHQPSKSHP